MEEEIKKIKKMDIFEFAEKYFPGEYKNLTKPQKITLKKISESKNGAVVIFGGRLYGINTLKKISREFLKNNACQSL